MKYKLGLVLSGGGTRGYAHIGALKAFEEAGYYPEVISGCSVGAIVGVLYADGYPPDEIYRIFRSKKILNLTRVRVPKKGLLNFSGLTDELEEHLRNKTFDTLKKKLFIAATNLYRGETEYFHQGSVIDKVVASACIPVMYSPITINNELYTDGGIMDNLPVKPIQSLCDKIIGVNIMPNHRIHQIKNLRHMAERIFQLCIVASSTRTSGLCDILIEPTEIADYGYLGSAKGKEMFDIGYRSTIETLNKSSE